MIWSEKLLIIINDYEKNNNLKIVFRYSSSATEEHLKHIENLFPNIDKDYIEFLSITDGASFWMYEVYGSDTSRISSLSKLHNRWKEFIDLIDVFPFAEDSEGNCIAFDKNGSVILFDYTLQNINDATILASSFAEFINDVLMGNRFYTLFESNSEIQNEWVDYLKDKKWLDN